ncbi:hypothetical protein RHCRD62_60342 [Rhodococcus sp. RD6.2]|nr:hypothetical protein RHCRD62_60342 [Rhodococcus sp. RD6.2]
MLAPEVHPAVRLYDRTESGAYVACQLHYAAASGRGSIREGKSTMGDEVEAGTECVRQV